MTRTKRPADYHTKNILDPCGRCGGSKYFNDYRANFHGGVCYLCNGRGGKMVSQAQLDRREADRNRRARKAAERAAAKAAEVAAEQAAKASEFEAWKTENADIVTFLQDTSSNPFVLDMQARVNTDQLPLTPKQADAVRKVMERMAQEPQAAPVIEGRIVITGKILTVKQQDSAYGQVTKMLVQDERGFKVWGTMPDAIATQLYDAWWAAEEEAEGDSFSLSNYGPDYWHDSARGHRVTFTARVEASKDDESFGFYTRPTKASVAE